MAEASEMLGVLLPVSVKRKLEKEAVMKGLKPSTYARTILIEHLRQMQTKKN